MFYLVEFTMDIAEHIDLKLASWKGLFEELESVIEKVPKLIQMWYDAHNEIMNYFPTIPAPKFDLTVKMLEELLEKDPSEPELIFKCVFPGYKWQPALSVHISTIDIFD